MEKLAAHEKLAAIREAAEAIRNLSQENDGLKEKLSSFQKKEQAQKLAMTMARKGLVSFDDIEKKAAELISGSEDLGVIEKALDLVKEGSIKLGSVSKDDEEGAVSSSSKMDELTAILVDHALNKG